MKRAGQTWRSKSQMIWHNSPWAADRATNWIRYQRDLVDVDLSEYRVGDLETRS